ncbi:MAG: hypothetical protein WC785_10950, partial [Tatlockia sp.]
MNEYDKLPWIQYCNLMRSACVLRELQCYEEQRGAASSVMIVFFATGSYLGTLIRNDGLLDVSIVLILSSIGSVVLHFTTVLENHRVNLVD